MDSLYLSFLQILSEKGARYLVAGGIAVNLYGCERMTRDLDIVLDLDDPPSMDAFFLACGTLNLAPLMPVKLEDFGRETIRDVWVKEKHMRVFCLALSDNPFFRIDVFVEKPDGFDTMFDEKQTLKVENEGRTFDLNLVSLDDLIAMKKEAGRDKDLLDINNLKKLKEYEQIQL